MNVAHVDLKVFHCSPRKVSSELDPEEGRTSVASCVHLAVERLLSDYLEIVRSPNEYVLMDVLGSHYPQQFVVQGLDLPVSLLNKVSAIYLLQGLAE